VNAIINCRIFCLPVYYPKIQRVKYNEAKKQYFHNQIAVSSNKIKTAWKIIKDNSGIPQENNIITKINCDNRTLSNTKDTANAFNKYYTQIAAKLGTENGDSNKALKLLRNTKFGNITQMKIIPVTEAEIKITIMSLNLKIQQDMMEYLIEF